MLSRQSVEESQLGASGGVGGCTWVSQIQSCRERSGGEFAEVLRLFGGGRGSTAGWCRVGWALESLSRTCFCEQGVVGRTVTRTDSLAQTAPPPHSSLPPPVATSCKRLPSRSTASALFLLGVMRQFCLPLVAWRRARRFVMDVGHPPVPWSARREGQRCHCLGRPTPPPLPPHAPRANLGAFSACRPLKGEGLYLAPGPHRRLGNGL